MNTPTRQSASARAIAHPFRDRACVVQIYGTDLGFTVEIDPRVPLVVGRQPGVGLRIELDSVSRRHCIIYCEGGAFFIRDEGSTNGTFLNGARVDTVAALGNGNQIRVGTAVFKFLLADANGSVEAYFHEAIYRLTITDGLTGLYNKRFLLDFIDREVARCQRYERPLAVVMIDIDHFKRINDAFGHLSGDRVLAELAQLLRPQVRRDECLARYGGEEFCAVFSEAATADACARAEEFRALCAAHRFPLGGDHQVTLSAGVAMMGPRASSASLLRAADRELYEAKRRGRNCVSPKSAPPEDASLAD